jgi:hypothetical protein
MRQWAWGTLKPELLLLLCVASNVVRSDDVLLWAWSKLNFDVLLLRCLALCLIRSVDLCDCGTGLNRNVG